MSGWQDVLDQQLDLYRFWRSPVGQQYAAGFGASMRAVESERGNPAVELPDHLAAFQIQSIVQAEPVYVDPEMMDVVEAAQVTFAPEPLEPTDLITSSAFVVLPRPMHMRDRHGYDCSFRAIVWHSLALHDPETGWKESGILLSLYSHIDDEDHYTLAQDAARGGREWRAVFAGEQGTPLSLVHTTPWAFGVDVPHTAVTGEIDWWIPVQAFMRLALQTITARKPLRVPRPSAKRWARALGRPKEDRYITVIRLRRPRSQNDHAGGTVAWSHRWIVGGHWRKQWFPSIQAHRQVWIGSYVKGPEALPLLIRRGRAFELVR